MSPMSKVAQISFDLIYKSYFPLTWIYDFQSISILDMNDLHIKMYGHFRKKFLSARLNNIHPQKQITLVLKAINVMRPVCKQSYDFSSTKTQKYLQTYSIAPY